DARAMSAHLTDPAIGRLAEDSVKLLLGEAAGRDAMVRALSKWLPEAAQGAEIALIYFAGHGMVRQIGSPETGILIPLHADPEDLLPRGIAMSDLAHWIDEIHVAAVVVCLDCCHAGRVIPRQVPAGGTPPVRDLGIRPAALRPMTGKDQAGKG